MAQISVGVPVYNAEQFLEECLTCLCEQTFNDFEVLIFDNASTDRTPTIAKKFVDRDPRFRLIRQPYNKGAAQNFLDALEASTAPYFMWRAYDDLSDTNFLQALYEQITKTPGVKLAVGQVSSVRKGRAAPRIFEAPSANADPGFLAIVRRLFQSHASWVYGLWDRDALRYATNEIWKAFPHAWASDHMLLFPFLIDNTVTGSNTTTFVQRIRHKSKPGYKRERSSPEEMREFRVDFIATCNLLLDKREIPRFQRLLFRPVVWLYAGKRVYSFRRLMRRSILNAVLKWDPKSR